MRRLLPAAFALLLGSLTPGAFGYLGNTLKSHNHSSTTGDGGQLSSPTIAGTLIVDSITVNGGMTVNGGQTTIGSETFQSSVTFNGVILNSSSTQTNGPSTQTSSATFKSNLAILGAINQPLTVASSTTLQSNLAILGAINQPLTVASSTTFQSGGVGISGNITGMTGLKMQSADETTNQSYIQFGNSVGSGRFGVESSVGGQIFGGTTANAAVVGNGANAPIQLATNNTARLTINGSGQVGIGTTSPTTGYAVSIAGGTSGQKESSSDETTGAAYNTLSNNSGTLRYGVEASVGGTTVNGTIAYAAFINQASAAALQFGTNNTIAETILSGGNIGVGTSNPQTPLHVIGKMSFGNPTTGVGLSDNVGVYAKSIDGATQNANCFGVLLWNGTNLTWTSTTTASASGFFGVLDQTCAPAAFCRVVTSGLTTASVNAGNAIGGVLNTSATRCQGNTPAVYVNGGNCVTLDAASSNIQHVFCGVE